MILQGIPITSYTKNTEISGNIKISLYEFVNKYINSVFILEEKYQSWVSDIQFDLRRKQCYIPYYTYELFNLPEDVHITDIDQFFVDDNNYVLCRFNYDLKVEHLELNKPYKVFLVDKEELLEVTFTSYIDEDKIDNDKLYQLYTESCYLNDGFDEHNKGYHYIDKSSKKLRNKEASLRRKLGLPTYKEEKEIVNYRDVRNFRIDELINAGIAPRTLESKKVRELRFTSYLYCCLRQKLTNEDFDKIKSTYDYFKIGKKIPLIVKGYWLDGYDYVENSWKKAHKV